MEPITTSEIIFTLIKGFIVFMAVIYAGQIIFGLLVAAIAWIKVIHRRSHLRRTGHSFYEGPFND